MGALKNLVGQKYGRLTVIARAENDKSGHAQWLCKCDCGREVIVQGKCLKSGNAQSCGCLRKELSAMRAFKDLTGQKFSRLLVLERVENSKSGKARWRCRCDCGNEIIATGAHLLSGNTKSCGCWKKQRVLETNIKHGLAHSKAYWNWQAMKNRCYNPDFQQYADYGGRGITVYEPWRNDFAAFFNYVSRLEHFGEEGMTLDRIDNDGNYEPGNLRWISRKMQTRNRRNTIIVEYNGEKMALAEAAEKSGIKRGILQARYHAGDRGEKLFRPVRQHK